MKTLFVKLFLFGLLLFIIDKPIGMLINKLNKAKDLDTRLDFILNGKINHDIVIIGSSRAVNGIQPSYIIEKTNQSCYNLGFSGSNILFHKTVFDLLIEYNKPKKVLLILDDEFSFTNHNNTIYRKDKLESHLENDKVLSIYCEQSSKNYISSKISWTYRENQSLFDAMEYIFKGKDKADITNNINEHGFIPLSDTISFVDVEDEKSKLVPYDENLELQPFVESFENFLSKAETNNIELYVIRMPSYKNHTTGFNERIMEIIGKRNFTYLDYSDLVLNVSYFYDNGHLNNKGAKVFSKILAENI